MKRMSKAQRNLYLKRALESIVPDDIEDAPSPGRAQEYLEQEWNIRVPIAVISDYQMGAITLQELELGDNGTVRAVQPAR